MPLSFTKMHGLGNDYLYVRAQALPDDPAGLSHPAKGPVSPAAPDAPGRGGHSLPAGVGGLHRAVSAGGVRRPLET